MTDYDNAKNNSPRGSGLFNISEVIFFEQVCNPILKSRQTLVSDAMSSAFFGAHTERTHPASRAERVSSAIRPLITKLNARRNSLLLEI